RVAHSGRSLVLPAALPQFGFQKLQAVLSLFEFLLFFFDYFLWRFVGETGFRKQLSRSFQHCPRFLQVLLQSRSVLWLISFAGQANFDRSHDGRRTVATLCEADLAMRQLADRLEQ